MGSGTRWRCREETWTEWGQDLAVEEGFTVAQLYRFQQQLWSGKLVNEYSVKLVAIVFLCRKRKINLTKKYCVVLMKHNKYCARLTSLRGSTNNQQISYIPFRL